MTSRSYGLLAGGLCFAATFVLPMPAGMTAQSWHVAGLVFWMAIWWMTQAVPLTATALLPFLVLPMLGIMDANKVAAAYYSPILFLILGGAFLALAIERTGLHRRLALAIVNRSGSTAWSLLLGFMVATALLSTFMSNTSSALIMLPMAMAVLDVIARSDREATGFSAAVPSGTLGQGASPAFHPDDFADENMDKPGFPAALILGIAFAASIGGIGTLVGSPTNAIAAGMINKQLGTDIDFLTWLIYGMPVVLLGIPLCAAILIKVQQVGRNDVDVEAARRAIGYQGAWTMPELRLVPIVMLVFALWVGLPLIEPLFGKGAITDGSIAILGGLLLFVLPDGTGRPLLLWKEADRAPWGVIMMFGGGLALAEGITGSGLAAWLGEAMEPLGMVPVIFIAAALVALVVLVTEFASNVATASAVMPVVASMVMATGVDPMLLAMPAAIAASWGFMMPSGTGPNALAWSTGRVYLPRMLKAGLMLDMAGIPFILLVVWAVRSLGF